MSTEIIVWIYEKIGVFVPVFQYFLIKSAMNKKIPSEKLRFHRGFHRWYGKISANRFDRYKNDVFPLLDVLNSHATE